MTNNRKKPTPGFWITVALGAVLVGYPLSFGPACWMGSQNWLSEESIEFVYWPILWIYVHGPVEVKDAILWYVNLGTPRGWHLILRNGDDTFGL
jgi:hypothetical protein